MATFPIRGLHVKLLNDRDLSDAVIRLPEGVAETFVAGAPVVVTGGFVVAAASPATAIFGFAMDAGSNTLANGDTLVRVLPVSDDVRLVANFLATGGTTNVLDATDLGGSFELELGAGIQPDGTDAWFVADQAVAPSVLMESFESDTFPANTVNNTFAAAGDDDARVTFRVLSSVMAHAG